MAEREGFEPPIPVKVCLLSRQVPSTTRPSLRATSAYILILSGTLFASSRRAHLNELSQAQRPRPGPGCDWLLHFIIWISSGPTVWVYMFRVVLTTLGPGLAGQRQEREPGRSERPCDSALALRDRMKCHIYSKDQQARLLLLHPRPPLSAGHAGSSNQSPALILIVANLTSV